MKKKRETLRYGDIIMLNFTKDSKSKIAERLLNNINSILTNKTAINSLMHNGFLSSYGFLNDELYFEKVDKKDFKLNFKNYLFVVTPKLNSEFHDEYKKSKKHLSKL